MIERRRVGISGMVQGVGFRPHVHALATRMQLAGFVRNRSGQVEIEVEGEASSLDAFLRQLPDRLPPLAKIDRLHWSVVEARGEGGFSIELSAPAGSTGLFIPPDVATCDDCVRELFDPSDRRFRYPFINCTHCGPRLTLIRELPYDRAATTMAGFPLCAACRAEYDDPGDRRFHAQPVACPACGPRLTLEDAQGEPLPHPLEGAAEALVLGRIVAIKGLGGYHLACDAGSPSALARLRLRKQRVDKPFALMVSGIDQARALCHVSEEDERLLRSPMRPIVLLPARPGAPVAASVAPERSGLGVMLPYTPLHHLLLSAVGGRALVMTSGNAADEPIAFRDEDARERLRGIAELFLVHDRPIHIGCDDSVLRSSRRGAVPVRRARGYAPAPLKLPQPLRRPTLAVGGQLKSAFALGVGPDAVVSHHLGDLHHFPAYQGLVGAIAHYETLYGVHPERIVHDLHPDYASTGYARERAAAEGVELLEVQHHHAHMASALAEHAVLGPAIGVVFDGTGYGLDGALWGGEFLLGDCADFRRVAHFRPVPLPGGEQAVREPWRMAAAYLRDAGLSDNSLVGRVGKARWRILEEMMERGVHAPLTSSVGRLFDAVAFLVGGPEKVSFEAQAAMGLESLAWSLGEGPTDVYDWELAQQGAEWVVDTRPLIRGLWRDRERGLPAEVLARRFHSTLAQMVGVTCARLHKEQGTSEVVLSGGVFCNTLLLGEATETLERLDLRPHSHRLVPPNDGGLCLGQLAVAAAQDGDRSRAHVSEHSGPGGGAAP